jgi:F-type H+-transporting ATPase subunit epsilon
MAETSRALALVVATPTGVAVRDQVEMVQVPGAVGEFGVLPGHLPLLSALKPGILRFRKQDRLQVAIVDAGYVEVEPDKVSILTERFVRPENIDVEAARKELAEAEEKLKQFPGLHEGAEHAEIVQAIDWAKAQIALGATSQ